MCIFVCVCFYILVQCISVVTCCHDTLFVLVVSVYVCVKGLKKCVFGLKIQREKKEGVSKTFNEALIVNTQPHENRGSKFILISALLLEFSATLKSFGLVVVHVCRMRDSMF